MAAISALGSAAPASAAQQREQIKAAAQQFEAIFLRQLLSSMRSANLAEDDLFGSQAGEQFRDMADGKTAESMSQQGVFGISEMLLNQFMARPATTVAPTTREAGA